MPPTFPIDYDAMRRAIVRAIQAATGLEQNGVIMEQPESPGIPRPPRPFISFGFLVPAARTGGDSIDGNVGGLWNLGGQRTITLSINSYGRSHEEAYGYLSLLAARLDGDPAVYGILQAAGMAVFLPGQIQDLSAIVGVDYEGRAQMDCTLGVASNILIDQGSITSAPVAGAVDSGAADSAPLALTVTLSQ
jgi:hypothetical protein